MLELLNRSQKFSSYFFGAKNVIWSEIFKRKRIFIINREFPVRTRVSERGIEGERDGGSVKNYSNDCKGKTVFGDEEISYKSFRKWELRKAMQMWKNFISLIYRHVRFFDRFKYVNFLQTKKCRRFSLNF